MTDACTEDRFLKDVSGHVMTIVRDDGVNRHVRFRRTDSSSYWFDLITWPGTLCIDGDMGTYVFRRLHDMFEFFRIGRGDWNYNRNGGLSINPGYWSEKLQAPDPRDAEEFSPEKFKQHVKERFDAWVEEFKPDDEYDPDEEKREFAARKDDLWDQIEEDILYYAECDDEREAYEAARQFEPNDPEVRRFDFEDAWEWRCREFKFHFIWCCYAIAWGVDAYDKATGSAA